MICISILGGLWLIGLIWFGHLIYDYPTDLQTQTDAIVVLTGGRNRVYTAIQLLNQGLAPRLFISGVPQNIGVEDIEKVSGTFAQHEEQIELGRMATSTLENAAEIVQWCNKNHIQSVRLVTSNYHIPRSMAEFNAHKSEIKVVVHPVYSEKVSTSLWNSWGVFRLIAIEYSKYLCVCLRNLCKG